MLIVLIFSTSCITLKKASFDTGEHQCIKDGAFESVEVEYYDKVGDGLNNPLKEEPVPKRYDEEYTNFLQNQGCMKVIKNSPANNKIKFVFEYERQYSLIGNVLELASILTLFIIPSVKEVTKSLNATLTDHDGKIVKQYRFEIETRQHPYLLAAPFIPFQRLKTEMDEDKLLLTGFINQAQADKLLK
jgi:hypothetical protein